MYTHVPSSSVGGLANQGTLEHLRTCGKVLLCAKRIICLSHSPVFAIPTHPHLQIWQILLYCFYPFAYVEVRDSTRLEPASAVNEISNPAQLHGERPVPSSRAEIVALSGKEAFPIRSVSFPLRV